MTPSAPPPPPWEPGPPWASDSLREPSPPQRPVPTVYEQLQADPGLQRLRAARRRPVFAVAGAVVGLYLLNALLAGEARGFMAVGVAGPLNIGLALSLIQCVTTAWAVWWYTRYARNFLDPDGRRLRAHVEKRENTR
ncbi:uncharacterized membrane protein (DUF485 family) [Streptomyces sp. SLBN-118]|uniref:DUF485 domain-containing protein n=1 Tax=Streptomyces sp. SLBN-118 TaxID=2768454 RepID=UPI00114D8FB8|nr:DUF485 domain-containing protein [Streptomyces sp. SLBN-118]TQK50512.1 uncharacterized membrane protein (DUF485 family) [Streptomyces sp. SLBN-118]